MLDMLTGILPPRKLLSLVADKITEATMLKCNHFEMIYSVEKNDLVFKIYNDDGTISQGGYPEGSSIGKLIQAQALSKLPENAKVLFCIVGWHRNDETKCLLTVHYIEDGKQEKLVTNF